jgi:ABC-2 type transport system ATP-binding protein
MMIEVTNLTKRYGNVAAVDQVSFRVEPGKVTGFLGPNGAGKSTTMRVIAGLHRPTGGTATVNGRAVQDHGAPLRELGVLLDAGDLHPGRRARAHLRALAATNGIAASRVDEVMELTGIRQAGQRRAGTFSLGMRQRLGIAAALLGDPQTLILDEPINGLDPEGVIWVRTLLRFLASEGRTVFLSSHLMSEMALTADHLVIIGQGRIVADAPLSDILSGSNEPYVRVRLDEPYRLVPALLNANAGVIAEGANQLKVRGMTAPQIALAAAIEQLDVTELATVTPSLEDAYLALTADASEYRSTNPSDLSGRDS